VIAVLFFRRYDAELQRAGATPEQNPGAKIWGKTFGADYRCLRDKGLTFTSLEPLSWSASEGKSQLKEQ
jgi:hypothetical protein